MPNENGMAEAKQTTSMQEWLEEHWVGHLPYERCLRLIHAMIDIGILQKDFNPHLGEGVYIYREAGPYTPEGWYFTPIEGAAYELWWNGDGQKSLFDALHDQGIPLPLSEFL